jgi:hypothetical protein
MISGINLIRNVVDLAESVLNKEPVQKENEPEKPKEFTFKTKISKEEYLCLKAWAKSYGSAGKALGQEISKNKGIVRYHLRNIKKDNGKLFRKHHVALMFLKGLKYSEIEPNVKAENKLTVDELYKTLLARVAPGYFSNLKNELKTFLES